MNQCHIKYITKHKQWIGHWKGTTLRHRNLTMQCIAVRFYYLTLGSNPGLLKAYPTIPLSEPRFLGLACYFIVINKLYSKEE